MVIKTIASEKIRMIWEHDDLSVVSMTYSYDIRDILFDLDAAKKPADLQDIGAIQYDPSVPHAWSVTVTVNSVEPCGAVTCDFWQGDCYNVDLREYNA